jgi:hypothetical protein
MKLKSSSLESKFFPNHNFNPNLYRARNQIKIMIKNKITIFYITIPPSTVKT